MQLNTNDGLTMAIYTAHLAVRAAELAYYDEANGWTVESGDPQRSETTPLLQRLRIARAVDRDL
jgi:hypothetical protein